MDLIETRSPAGVAVLTFNRPEQRNPLDADLINQLLAALQRAADDPAVGSVVLAGAGAAFSAGGDVAGMAEAAAAPADVAALTESLRRMMTCARLLHEMPKPTIAAVSGAAAGAGLSLALACDLRVASPEARFLTAFARLGVSGDFGGSYFLSRLVGAGRARELYFLSEPLRAQEAFAWGIVNRLVEPGQALNAAVALAENLAAGPRRALAAMKRNLNLAEEGRIELAFEQEAALHVLTLRSPDHAEAAAAFLAKRPPRFGAG